MTLIAVLAALIAGGFVYWLAARVLLRHSERRMQRFSEESAERLRAISQPALDELGRAVEATEQPLMEAEQALARSVVRLERLVSKTEELVVIREEVERAVSRMPDMMTGMPLGFASGIEGEASSGKYKPTQPRKSRVEWEPGQPVAGRLTATQLASIGARENGDRVLVGADSGAHASSE